jgi:O-methyltransferase
VATFARYGHPVDGRRVHLHRGLFEDTPHLVRPVSLAHIDCDWFEPVKLCPERIWPRLSRGGFEILDDYSCHGGCSEAVDAFVADRSDAMIVQLAPTAVLRKANSRRVP